MENYSEKLKESLTYSKEEAERLNNNSIAPEHLLLGLLREGNNTAVNILTNMGISPKTLKQQIEKRLKTTATASDKMQDHIELQEASDDILKYMQLEARSLGAKTIDTEHLLLAILKTGNNIGEQLLKEHKIDYFIIRNYMEKSQSSPTNNLQPIEDDDEEDYFEFTKKETANKTANTVSETPALDKFGTDLTQAAAEDKLDPIVGRETEIERMLQILCRRKKNNPILIGEPGVGKTAIVEGMASLIVKQKVPRQLLNKKIISLDMASVVAGTKYRGQFEERIKALLNELQKNHDIILFIDEIHTIIGAGGAAGSLDAANIIKPALARGEMQCIGATTIDEYRKNIEKDSALERRFQKILIEPTGKKESLQILQNIKFRYEDHHHVHYTQEALETCINLSERYINDRCFPDKAIDVLDEAGSKAKLKNIDIPDEIKKLKQLIQSTTQKKVEASKAQNYELAAELRDTAKQYTEQFKKAEEEWNKSIEKNPAVIDKDDIAEVIATMTGVPTKRIAQNESTRLKQMAQKLEQKIIGQPQAIEKTVKAIQRNRIGLKDPNKPIGTFIFLGPTGVGKTHLAKTLSEELFDSNDAIIRIDMSEYLEKFSVSRLIGAPPGYVGHEDGGQLTEKVRRKPYSIILLDEIEKAHPDVFNLLLQVMDEGRLTDSLGRIIDFKNTIIIMTSNIGTRQLKDFGNGIGFASANHSQQQSAQGIIQKALSKTFSPEFLNRVDEIIFFNELDQESIQKIIDIELDKLNSRLKQIEIEIELTPEAKKFVTEKGYDAKYGARPLKRAIQKYIEDPLTEYLLEHEKSQNAYLKLDKEIKEDKLSIQNFSK